MSLLPKIRTIFNSVISGSSNIPLGMRGSFFEVMSKPLILHSTKIN